MSNFNRPIEEYALIGDCVTAALINADGGIDWMCLPAFDGPSIFGALLDGGKGGDFSLRPSVPYRVERRYVEDSAIFETRFITAQGSVKLTDFFVVARSRNAHGYEFSKLHPTRKLVRLVEVESGSGVPLELNVRARPDYGRDKAVWTKIEHGGFTCPQANLSTNTGLVLQEHDLKAAWNAKRGECYFVALDYGEERPVATLEDVRRWHEVTAKFWEHWGFFNHYEGLHSKIVRRSAITLKLLTYAPTGVFVAAPTTSLPEIAGGEANWDYRFAWVRDTSFFINTLLRLGYSDEAMAFLHFVVKDSMQRHEKGEDILPIFYAIREQSQIEELKLDHLGGYLESRPVRIGNNAIHQFQLDSYADILETFFYYKHIGGRINGDKMKLVRQVAGQLLQHWREPDNGLWEEKEKAQLTYGKVATWSALMRAASLSHLQGLGIKKACADIQAEVLARAVRGDPSAQHLVSQFDSDHLDAACLLPFLQGFSDPLLARGTRQLIERELGDGPFLYRNPEHKKKGEGAFFLCMFWRINHLVKEGELARAEELLEETLGMMSPFGLLAEQIDPHSRAFRGNFPQAFSHLGLIDSILNVDQARRQPRMASLADHEKFTQSVGQMMGLRGIIAGFIRNPKMLRLLWRSGGSKWKG